MWRRLAATLILLTLVACSARAGTAERRKGCGEAEQVETMAAEFRVLRAIQGHFRGGAWNADVDAWMGRKHRVMIDLEAQLGAAGCLQEQVVALLGAPDRIAQEGDPAFDQIRDTPSFAAPAGGPYELLIYEWRGEHDFLYLINQNEVIAGSGWWHAGD